MHIHHGGKTRTAWVLLAVAVAGVAQDGVRVLESVGAGRRIEASAAQDLGSVRRVVRTTSADVESLRFVRVDGSRSMVATWTERTGGVDAAWFSASVDGGALWTEAAPASFELLLQYASFDPLVGVPAVPAELAASTSTRRWIVQYVAPGVPAMRDALKPLGVEVLHHLPRHADVVDVAPSVVESLRALPFVRWVGPFHPAYRLFPADRADLAAGRVADMQPWNVAVYRPHDLAAKETVARDLAAVGAARFLPVVLESRLLTLALPASAVLTALRHEQVAWIDRWSPAEDDMDLARVQTGANFLAALPVPFTGHGVRGQVMDSGTRSTHVDFAGIMWQGAPVSASHGTSTYGIVFGKGVANPLGLGMLPDAQGIAGYSGDPGMTANRYLHTQQLLHPPFEASFQSNSWGSTQTPNYTSTSQLMDDIVFDLDVTILQSQSNEGNQNSRPQAWAKNVVSVGGIRHYNTQTRADDAWAAGASIGPAADGRLKPDVSNYYDSTFTTSSTSDTSYTSTFGGTSGATPITAGCVGLLHQMWDEGVFGATPPGSTPFARKPRASTTKALLVNTADQYAFVGAGADLARVKQGWGTGDVARAYTVATEGKLLVVDETVVLGPFASAAFPVTVAPGEAMLKATMVYRDPAGTTSATQHRINNLDLRVTAPGGSTYLGNVGLDAGNWSVAGGVANGLDTVENVFVQNPAAGVWLVEVLASELNQDAHAPTYSVDAAFSLVVSGATPAPPSPGSFQFNQQASWLDVNAGVDAFGRRAGFGISGPFTAVSDGGGSLAFSFGGAPNRPLILAAGALNPGNAVLPGFGSLDIGLFGPGNLSDVAIVMDGLSGTGLFDFLANTGATGGRTLAFTTPSMPPGVFASFQAVVVPATGSPLLTAAFQVWIY